VAHSAEEGNSAPNAGRELFLRNMRKVLRRDGLSDYEIDVKIEELLKRDVRRLAAIIARPRG
jgi:hypothetical protein